MVCFSTACDTSHNFMEWSQDDVNISFAIGHSMLDNPPLWPDNVNIGTWNNTNIKISGLKLAVLLQKD